MHPVVVTITNFGNISEQSTDNNEISTLTMNGQCISDTKSKATVLNNYFKSIFTKENLTQIPPMANFGSSLPCISNIKRYGRTV